MAKKPKSKRILKETVSKAPLRTSPNWALLAISIAGIGLTGYLTFASWSGAQLQGCAAGSGCDVVLTSQWATMFGLPTALWGFLAYAGMAGIAFIKRADTHWRYAWTAALFGVAYSVYLTTVSVRVLGATCPYCLTSLALMTGILALTTYQRPSGLPRFSWQRWLTWRIPLAAVFVFALHLQYVGVSNVPDDPMAQPLAEHLAATGAKFYGASWCQHCQEQKRYFGDSADDLPYIECTPGGQGAPMTRQCRDNLISTYPTWIINDRRVEGVQSLSTLAEMSGFKNRPEVTN